ncbi:hypothetical protein [Paenarthrobacter sp. NPDC089316]|uniref:hypothetical protein n=1 Tax=unclassified Paenarthrobacter TaxID=2634190 RepID=UPI003445EE11
MFLDDPTQAGFYGALVVDVAAYMQFVATFPEEAEEASPATLAQVYGFLALFVGAGLVAAALAPAAISVDVVTALVGIMLIGLIGTILGLRWLRWRQRKYLERISQLPATKGTAARAGGGKTAAVVFLMVLLVAMFRKDRSDFET